MAFLGFSVFTLAAWGVHDTNERLEHPTARTTPATIDEVHECIGKCDDYLVVSFETRDGRTVTTELHDAYWQPHPRVGDGIEVRYDPTDPETYLRDERLGSDGFSFWLLTASAGAMAGMTVLSLRIRPLFRGRVRLPAHAAACREARGAAGRELDQQHAFTPVPFKGWRE